MLMVNGFRSRATCIIFLIVFLTVSSGVKLSATRNGEVCFPFSADEDIVCKTQTGQLAFYYMNGKVTPDPHYAARIRVSSSGLVTLYNVTEDDTRFVCQDQKHSNTTTFDIYMVSGQAVTSAPGVASTPPATLAPPTSAGPDHARQRATVAGPLAVVAVLAVVGLWRFCYWKKHNGSAQLNEVVVHEHEDQQEEIPLVTLQKGNGVAVAMEAPNGPVETPKVESHPSRMLNLLLHANGLINPPVL